MIQNLTTTPKVFLKFNAKQAQMASEMDINDLESFEFTPNPRGYTQPKQDFVRSFGRKPDNTVDPRRDLSAVVNVISNTFYRSAKYTFPQTPQPSDQYDGELNYKLMRYSDFLLLYAEALNENSQTTAAVDLVNQVRQHPSVWMPPSVT